jgi:hypothetical protein
MGRSVGEEAAEVRAYAACFLWYMLPHSMYMLLWVHMGRSVGEEAAEVKADWCCGCI